MKAQFCKIIFFALLGIFGAPLSAESVEEILKRAKEYQNPKNLPTIHTMHTILDADIITKEGDSKIIDIKEVFSYPSNLLMHLSAGGGDLVVRTYDGSVAKVCRDGHKVTILTPKLHPKDYQDLLETVRRRKLLIMEQLYNDYKSGKATFTYIKKLKLKRDIAHKIIRRDSKTGLKIELFFDVKTYKLLLAKMDSLENPEQMIAIQFLKYKQVTKSGRTPNPGQKYMNYPQKAKIYNSDGKLVGKFHIKKVSFGFLATDKPAINLFKDPTLPFPKS